ncbi:MAG TPA: prolyl oligopeptidase family serine peptidase [Steroidobacteraceae bacterium]|nr:prolyl oligopeptidase family serine peptidase [Steroidobacteraceae bacterium]
MKTYLSHLRIAVATSMASLFAACAASPNATKTASPPPPQAALAQAPAAASIASATASTPSAAPVYPPTARGDVVDNYHGTQVADPYRWLEQLDSDATKQWVNAQNALSQPRLEALPARPWVKQRLTELWSYERFNTPTKAGKRYFFTRNDGKQNQSVLYVSEDLQSNGRVLFDPNTASKDATIALAEYTPSPDGNLVAYALSDGGTDWEIFKFKRADTGADLPDSIVRTKFFGVSWARDGSGVYYSKYPARPDAPQDSKGDDAGRPDIYFHKLGEPQDRDRLVYVVKDSPTYTPQATVTEDGRYLIITLSEGTIANGVDVLDLKTPNAKPRKLFSKWDALYLFIGSKGDELFFQTTNNAPQGRVIAVNAKRTEPAPSTWKTVVPQSDMTIDTVHLVADRLIVTYVKDAHGVARLFETDGRAVGDVPLAGLGSIAGFSGESRDQETFFSYTDYVTPTTIYHYDPRTNAATAWRTPRIPAKTDVYVTEQVFYKSKDGTRVPMFITHRRDMPKDGNQPVLLYGYGGFDISATPTFRAQVLAWLDMGGVFAEANLRGGGEYGEAWHLAGVRDKKQNVFDDFIAAAEYLIAEKYTNPKRLAIHGRSNGGLLVGATLVQRPDLFGAALPAVGVLDMLRYDKASANARQWSTDYGLSENPDDFKAQIKYSPYHNTKPGTCYPPTLITTADHDDRVVPWHSFKFAAALQHAQGCPNPILIRIETRAGHGAGKPVWMQIEDFADQWAFVANALGMTPPAS